MSTQLTTRDGFPRADIDVAQGVYLQRLNIPLDLDFY